MRIWQPKSPVSTVRRYIDAMNARDFVAVRELLADDFRLIDNSESEICGADLVLDVLQKVVELAPDYQLHASAIIRRGDEILIAGHAESANELLSTSTQWRARADKHHMLEWQSYSHRLTPSLVKLLSVPESKQSSGKVA